MGDPEAETVSELLLLIGLYF